MFYIDVRFAIIIHPTTAPKGHRYALSDPVALRYRR
jgi:hypothetical protein